MSITTIPVDNEKDLDQMIASDLEFFREEKELLLAIAGAFQDIDDLGICE